MSDAHNQERAAIRDAPQPMIVAMFDIRALSGRTGERRDHAGRPNYGMLQANPDSTIPLLTRIENTTPASSGTRWIANRFVVFMRECYPCSRRAGRWVVGPGSELKLGRMLTIPAAAKVVGALATIGVSVHPTRSHTAV